MKRILIVPFAGSIIFFSASLFAQLQSRSLESIAPSEVFIANPSSTHTVNFRISGNRCSPPVDARGCSHLMICVYILIFGRRSGCFGWY